MESETMFLLHVWNQFCVKHVYPRPYDEVVRYFFIKYISVKNVNKSRTIDI